MSHFHLESPRWINTRRSPGLELLGFFLDLLLDPLDPTRGTGLDFVRARGNRLLRFIHACTCGALHLRQLLLATGPSRLVPILIPILVILLVIALASLCPHASAQSSKTDLKALLNFKASITNFSPEMFPD